MNVKKYDLYNSLNLELLNGVLLNDTCLNQFVGLNGVAELGRIVQEQPMPSEMDDDWDYGP